MVRPLEYAVLDDEDGPTHRCPSCQSTVTATFTGTVEFSVEVGCPFCGTMMDRLDPLGLLDAESRGDAAPLRFVDVYHDGDAA